MGEFLLYVWVSGILSAWDSRNLLMLTLLIGGPLVLFVAAWVSSRPRAVVARLNRAWKVQEWAVAAASMASTLEAPSAPSGATQPPDEWRQYTTPSGAEVIELGEPVQPVPDADRVLSLQLEVHRLRGVVEAFNGPAVGRLKGRVVSWRRFSVALAVLNGIGHQVLYVQVPDEADRDELPIGVMADLACRWADSRLVVERVIQTQPCSDPLPEIPQKNTPNETQRDGQLPTLDELNQQAQGEGWGHLNHSAYRVPIAWHITSAPKGRAKAFEGKGREVQAILRTVAEAEGLRVIAVAAEPDHVHLLGLPAGPGGMPPSWTWSRWVGRFKALSSRKLKTLPGLQDFEWQTGYAITAVSGGRQGAEEALAVVKAYVEGQGDQD